MKPGKKKESGKDKGIKIKEHRGNEIVVIY
jgi:hypothetical protein